MEGIRIWQQTVDFQLLKDAVKWTAASETNTAVVYVAAELLILVLPLVLLYLWEQRTGEHVHDRVGGKKAVIMAAMSVTVGLALKTLLAFVFFRMRPFAAHPELGSLELHVDVNSFPSSHAMIAFAVAASLWFSGYRKLGGVLFIVAIAVAVARVFAGVHYPSDVAAGALVGLVSAWYLHREASSLRRYLPNK